MSYNDTCCRIKEAEIERLQGQITQIRGQVAIADKGNWRDVVDTIGFIAEGRFESGKECDHTRLTKICPICGPSGFGARNSGGGKK